MTAEWEAFLPERVAALERDDRGYPIPFIVMRDAAGKAMFAINDEVVVARCIREKRCHVCGHHLDPMPWFVGGPGAALLNGDHAAYNDGPMHHDCMQFALRACPHLLQRMVRPVSPTQAARAAADGISTLDPTTIAGTPEVFVAVQGYSYRRPLPHELGANFIVPRPFRKVEYWQAGAMMPKHEGEKAAKQAARRLQDRLKAGA